MKTPYGISFVLMKIFADFFERKKIKERSEENTVKYNYADQNISAINGEKLLVRNAINF